MVLDSRALGTFPVSIATALAFDGLYGKHPDNKGGKDLSSLASVVYVNLRTLWRNVYGAVEDREKADSVSAKQYMEAILNEISEIDTHLLTMPEPMDVVFYLPTYRSLARRYGSGNLKLPNTPLQKKKVELENGAMDLLLDRFKSVENKPFIEVDVDIDVKQFGKVFVLSHLPMDLLAIKGASDIYLLESHTGAVKGKRSWYTKLSSVKNPVIPFNKATMLFFGDSGGIFKAQPMNFRKRLVEVAEASKWNFGTTDARMTQSLMNHKEPNILKTIRSFF